MAAYSQPRVRDEMKTYDTGVEIASPTMNFDTAGNSTAANARLLNSVAQGNSAITRIGKRIIMKALQIRGVLSVNTSATQINEKCSILLVFMRSVNGNATTTMPAITEILANPTPNCNSLTNRDYASKHKILRRWDYILTGNNTDSAGPKKIIFEEYVVFKKPLVAQWTSGGTTGAIAEFEKGALVLITIGQSAHVLNQTPIFSCNTRLYFNESDGYVY